jgi:hypothetical protein
VSIFETSGAPRKGTNAQVVEYWREAWPEAMDAWQRRSRPRQAAAVEIFSHLPTSAPPARESRAATSAPQPRLGGHAVAGAAPVRAAIPQARTGGLFVDAAQTERAAVSPLGGVAT